MDQSLPRRGETFLGNDHAQQPADPDGDPAAWIAPVAPNLTLHTIRLIGLVCALILGLTSISTSRAVREEASPLDRAGTIARVQSGSPVHATRFRSSSIHRSHKHPFAIPRIVLSYDPNDDTTSGEPDEDDDDETSKFLDGSDDTDAPIIARLEEMAPCPIPHECAAVPWTAPPSSPLLTLQRLLC